MNNAPKRPCCGGEFHSKGYSTEPEVIDLRPFEMNAQERSNQLEKLNDLFRHNRQKSADKANMRRRQALLTPLFKVLEELDHNDPKNTEIISNIKGQLLALTQREKSPNLQVTKVQSGGVLRNPSAFTLKMTPPTPADALSSSSERKIDSSRSSIGTPESVLIEDANEPMVASSAGCDGILDYLLNMVKHYLPGYTAHQTTGDANNATSLDTANDDAVATHNHSSNQPCRPSCWAFDTAQLAKTHAYLNDETSISAQGEAKKSPPSQSASLAPRIQGHPTTMTLRVPINFTGI